MANDPRLEELLDRWEDQREQGKPVAPEELCRDAPELLPELRRRIRALQAMEPMLKPPANLAQPSPAGGAKDSSTMRAPPAGYRIIGEIARGGMGIVYKAVQTANDRTVALKTIPQGKHAGREVLARFKTEAEAVANLHHPNIVEIYEVGEVEGQPFFAMEFVGNGSLEDHYDGRPMPPRDAARMLVTLARAMQHAHDHGVVHRDLKPSNVLLTEDFVPKIADFGLAKRLGGPSLTRTGDILGTPCFMTPEQATGKAKTAGPLADVFALGALLYTLLTGDPPFDAETELETIRQVIYLDPPPPSAKRPSVPPDLDAICLKCLEKDPANRYGSARELAEDLERFLTDQPIQAKPRALHGRHLRAFWRRRSTLIVGAVVLAALGAVAVWLWIGPHLLHRP